MQRVATHSKRITTVQALAAFAALMLSDCDRARYVVRNVDSGDARDVTVAVVGGHGSNVATLRPGDTLQGQLPHRETASLRVRWRDTDGVGHEARCEIYLVTDTEVSIELAGPTAALHTDVSPNPHPCVIEAM